MSWLSLAVLVHLGLSDICACDLYFSSLCCLVLNGRLVSV